jgi:hypothetical protein
MRRLKLSVVRRWDKSTRNAKEIQNRGSYAETPFTYYHGVDGRGHGPVAPALKVAPTDLSLLARNNSGKFPATHIVAVLQNGSALPAHGTALMPVWGPIFGRMNVSNQQERQLRITNVSRYLETLQVK